MSKNVRTILLVMLAGGVGWFHPTVYALNSMHLTNFPNNSGKLVPASQAVADRTIRGQVTDETATPLPGVSVLVKGTTTGTITDADGRFTLNVPDEGTIVFSYVGFVTQEITLGTSNVINLSMVPDVKSLSEVVV